MSLWNMCVFVLFFTFSGFTDSKAEECERKQGKRRGVTRSKGTRCRASAHGLRVLPTELSGTPWNMRLMCACVSSAFVVCLWNVLTLEQTVLCLNKTSFSTVGFLRSRIFRTFSSWILPHFVLQFSFYFYRKKTMQIVCIRWFCCCTFIGIVYFLYSCTDYYCYSIVCTVYTLYVSCFLFMLCTVCFSISVFSWDPLLLWQNNFPVWDQ